MVCDCLVELEHVFIDKTFTYKVPLKYQDKIKVGMKATLPFGKQVLEGFILKIENSSNQENLKEIIDLDDTVILDDELLELGKFIKKTTLSTLMSAYQAMLPLAVKAKKKVHINKKYEQYITLNENFEIDKLKLNDKQKKIIELLKKDKVIKKELLNLISPSSVKTLIKNNVIIESKNELYRLNQKEVEYKPFKLNESQEKVYKEVIDNLDKTITYLLYGVTGSGKTNVYMEIIDKVIKNGKAAIVLVPEISLTPQIISRFSSKFKDRVAVLHSGLSTGEKYDEWRKIKEGKVEVVVGARSAIFAPLKNIGVIIIDEEHSQTYKQENTPKYNAIDIAKERSKYHKCPLILGSATPSLESYARALKGVYHLLELTNRYNNKPVPKAEIIDMNKEFKKSNGYLSKPLIDEITKTIEKDEQVILFLNRRGYSNFITCPSCGSTLKCPNCDITLTYHKTSNMLRCHYCGYAEKKQDLCPKCHEELRDFGIGTEKVEENLKELIPQAKVLRMDIDTTTKKNSHEEIINKFLNKEANILLGTQMIAKGLDFPSVTLVGVINADISLNFPDFRASETTFQLLNQVSGRSGRGDKEGKVLIQTFNKDHYAIKYSIDNNYIGFFNEEMKIRRSLGYPPYYYICQLRIVSKDYKKASDTSIKIANYLKDNLKETILGPSLANIFKINNKYRFQILIKYKDINNIIGITTKLQEHFFNNNDIKLEIDFNPIKL